MARLTLKGKGLKSIGYPQGPAISVAIGVMEQYYKHHSTESALDILKAILEDPLAYRGNEHLDKIVLALLPKEQDEGINVQLNQTGIPVSFFGREHMEDLALHQMDLASRLPIAVAAALMPDAHSGYGLPIGGVLATENAVIPYGVGVDIGCRMSLSIFDIPVKDFYRKESIFTRVLEESTLFGSGAAFKLTEDHVVMERSEFYELPLLNKLHGRARKQLGTSGSGNHFVEFGIVEIAETDPVLGVPAGSYVGLLSHSGSRGLGAGIADHYTKIARQKRRLPGEAANLAWLTLDEAEGMEYWLSMNLAGDYARACHEVIHARIAWELSRKPIAVVENHHNFAWKETHEGREWIVHRKGATPAGRDVLGIIPGSMTARGFIVKGKGVPASLSSAAHGAGRRMSRTVAANSISRHAMKEELARHGVRLLGGGLDEAPHAYKDIEAVMKSQQCLVDVLGTFTPKIVRMDKNTGRG